MVHKQEPPPNPVYRTQIHGHKCSCLVHNDVNGRDSKQKPGCGQPGAGVCAMNNGGALYVLYLHSVFQ